MGLLGHVANQKDLKQVCNFCEKGDIVPVIDTIYHLEDTPQAFSRLDAGEVTGKVVIRL
jgi:D-arabinose 1-dehydrogenase-like Zn-dependent alcohol dehydrogenase